MLVFVLTMSMSAFAGSLKNTVNVKGTRARAFLEIAEGLGIADGAMGGKRWMAMSGITCTKTVNEFISRVTCEVENTYEDANKSLKFSTDDASGKGRLANDLRVLLNELTGAEEKVFPFQKRIEIKALECEGRGINHDLDDVDIETKYSCIIIIK
jgi:hypothetical protein